MRYQVTRTVVETMQIDASNPEDAIREAERHTTHRHLWTRQTEKFTADEMKEFLVIREQKFLVKSVYAHDARPENGRLLEEYITEVTDP